MWQGLTGTSLASQTLIAATAALWLSSDLRQLRKWCASMLHVIIASIGVSLHPTHPLCRVPPAGEQRRGLAAIRLWIWMQMMRGPSKTAVCEDEVLVASLYCSRTEKCACALR